MARLRLAVWNSAWFARLFDRRDRLLADPACWRVRHPDRDPECRAGPALAAALSAAPDHYPVSADLPSGPTRPAEGSSAKTRFAHPGPSSDT